MTKTMLLCGAVLTVMPWLTPAKDYPLDFKTLTASEAMSFPGGSGRYGMAQLAKPPGIVKEPPAVSRHPLYGQLSAGANGVIWFRLDESKGDGQGYDRLIVDINQNGDLTDDPVVQATEPAGRSSAALQPQRMFFGPIPVPESKKIGAGRPIYFAQLYMLTAPAMAGPNQRNMIIGQLRLKPGWYLETTVDMDGVARKVGIVDGNCNFQLGTAGKPMFYRSGAETNWVFQGGDYFLVNNDGSGKFDNSIGNNESVPFGPVLYLGAKPCKAVLAADGTSLSLEPWAEPLSELSLQPHGDQVNEIQVAWESAPGQWQLLQPGVENGKAAVPPGNYRLYQCQIKAQTSGGETLTMNGTKRNAQDTTKAEAGAPTPFKCGAPLVIKVAATRENNVVPTAPGSSSPTFRFFTEQPLQENIQASAIGAGGETYSGFYLQGKGGLRQPPKPVYAITTSDGKQVESGDMEFG